MAIPIMCPKCQNRMYYDGHGHNYSVYKCPKCGHEEHL